MKTRYIQYYVEGEDEEAIVNVLKSRLKLISAGKVQKLNVVQHSITDARLRTLKPGTMVVLVFDTDTGHRDMLINNLEKLKRCSAVSEIVTIPQVPDLEAELVRSCDIRKITELLNSRSKKDYKADLIRANNLDAKLREHHFNIRIFWSSRAPAPYQDIENRAEQVKKPN